LVLGNAILGSSTLSSRLGIRIRQQEGLSYGVTSALTASAFDARGAFSITAICNPQNMARLEVCVQDELQRLLRDGVTAEEVIRARQGYLDSQKVARANDAAIAGALAAVRQAGRTMQWQADFEKKLQALTPETVNAALRRHLDPAKLVIVTAGDFSKPSGG
jgi:zinc protease